MNIWNAISGVIFKIVEFGFSLLPEADISFLSTINTTVESIGEYIGSIDWIIPAVDLIAVLGFIITIEFTIVLYKVVSKIINIISLSHVKI